MNGSGGIKLGGCGQVAAARFLPTAFAVGDTVYVRSLCKRGRLKGVVIGRINRLPPELGVRFNYVDRTNAVWLEVELCWQTEAIALAVSFYQSVINAGMSVVCQVDDH